MIVLYDSDTISFNSLGIGVLTDFKGTPKITEVLKGEYILEFDYLKNGRYSEYLDKRNIVKALDQPFRIENIKPSKSGYRVLARHIVFDLKDNFLLDVAPTKLTAQSALSWCLNKAEVKTPFEVVGDCSNIASARYVRLNFDEVFWSADNSILNRFGGEPEYNNYKIILHSRRGKNSGIEIREKKNLTGFEMNIDLSTVKTRVMPIGKDALLLPEKFVDSPLLKNYSTPKIGKIDVNIEIDDETSEEVAYNIMREEVIKQFDCGLDKPVVSLKVDFIELSKTEEYKEYQNLETVSLGDSLKFYMPSLNQRMTIRVIKTVRNAMTGRIIRLELGNEIPTIVTQQQKNNSIIKSQVIYSAMEQAILEASNLINHPFHGHTYISKETGEFYVMDTTDIKTAKNIWKWGLGGLGFSRSGISGPFETAWTQDGGFVASFITSGKMSVERIEGLEQLLLTVDKNINFLKMEIGTDELLLKDSLKYKPVSFSIQGHSKVPRYIYPSNNLYPSDNLYLLGITEGSCE